MKMLVNVLTKNQNELNISELLAKSMCSFKYNLWKMKL
jgi:hypothetical protein